MRAVLFYSPSCGHCEYVINEVLPPLAEKYQEQFSILGVDVSTQDGQELFLAAVDKYKLETVGVPLLAIGDTYLYGSTDIPAKLPGMIEQLLAQGGAGWPEIPGLVEGLSAAGAGGEAPAGEAGDGMLLQDLDKRSLGAKFASDPAGNSLAVAVLAGMLLTPAGAALYWQRSPTRRQAKRPFAWLVPVLCLVGLGVAGYLAYVETAQVEAVCGPVGDCNTVQQSDYARLFGVLPIGVLGLAGYVLILLSWLVGQNARPRLKAWMSLAVLGLCAVGLLFSIYLTFLEPFVIGATCAWCLTSAVIMTALFWLNLAPARAALPVVRGRPQHAKRRK